MIDHVNGLHKTGRNPGGPIRCRGSRLVLWLLWLTAVLSVYYRQIWHLVTLGVSAWVADNYSLERALSGSSSIMNCLVAFKPPAIGKALPRALTAILGAGLVLLTAQVLGWGLCRLLRWQPENWREAVLYQTTAGIGVLTYLSLGLAVLGQYQGLNVRILIVLVLVTWIAWVLLRWTRTGTIALQIGAPTGSASRQQSRPRREIWPAIAYGALLIAFIGAIAPEIEYDALWYHLWLPKLWLDHGHPVDPVVEYISLYPLTWELLLGAGMVWGGAVAAKLLHFACLPLTGLLVYQFTRRFVPMASPWLAVALLFTVPTVLWEATTAYNDLALALLTGMVVYGLFRYVETEQWQWLVLAALNMGLALAVKHLALFVLLLATGGLAVRLWLEKRDLRHAIGPTVLFGAISLLLPLPWYLRAWLASGNPVFPDLYGIFGAFPPERWNTITERGLAAFKSHFGRPRTILNLLFLPWDVTIHAARYGGSLGPVFLLLLPVLIIRRDCARAVPWLLSFVLLYLVLWASPVSSFQARFLIPTVPLLAVMAAEAYRHLAAMWREMRWSEGILALGMAALLILNLPPFTSLHEGDRGDSTGWLTHVIHEMPVAVVIGCETQPDYLARRVRSYDAWHYINAHLPADARVLTFSGGDNLYSERERISSDATSARQAVWGSQRGQEGAAIQAMRNLRISHVLFDKRQWESGQLAELALVQPEFMTQWYDLEYEDSNFLLVQLRWGRPDDQVP